MKKSILLVSCIVLVTLVFGQSSIDKTNVSKISSTTEAPTKPNVSNEVVSDYFQFEKKLIQWTKGRIIPTSVPKHQITQSKSDYAVIILHWAKNHQGLLEDKFKAKVADETSFANMIKKAEALK
jgi:hypothetical protein